MSPGLLSEAEEDEEQQCERDVKPVVELEVPASFGDENPLLQRELPDTAETEVEVGEALVGVVDLEDSHDVDTEGDGAYDLNACHSHKTEVTVEGEVVVRGQELAEFFAALRERNESSDWANRQLHGMISLQKRDLLE